MASSLSFLRSSLSSSLLFLRGRTRNEIQLLPQLQQQQIRWNWQVKIRQRLNPQTGEMEDIGNSRMWLAGADNRVQPFADRFLHYEKPWMKKKRLKISSVLMRRAQAVNNLVAYIKVKRDFKKKRDE